MGTWGDAMTCTEALRFVKTVGTNTTKEPPFWHPVRQGSSVMLVNLITSELISQKFHKTAIKCTCFNLFQCLSKQSVCNDKRIWTGENLKTWQLFWKFHCFFWWDGCYSWDKCPVWSRCVVDVISFRVDEITSGDIKFPALLKAKAAQWYVDWGRKIPDFTPVFPTNWQAFLNKHPKPSFRMSLWEWDRPLENFLLWPSNLW